MAGALRHAAGDPALHQSCRRPLRFAARRPVQHARALGRLQQQDQPVDGEDRQGRYCHVALRDHGDGQSVDAAHAELPGSRELQGQMVPHGPVAQGRRRFHGPARRHHRHGLVRRAVDPAHRQPSQAPACLPAHGEFQPARAQRAARRGQGAQAQGRVSRAPPRRLRHAVRHRRLPAALQIRARGQRGGTPPDLRGEMGAKAAASAISTPTPICS